MLCMCRYIKQIEELKSENKILKGNIEELKSKTEKLKGKNEELKCKNEEFKSEFNEKGNTIICICSYGTLVQAQGLLVENFCYVH